MLFFNVRSKKRTKDIALPYFTLHIFKHAVTAQKLLGLRGHHPSHIEFGPI